MSEFVARQRAGKKEWRGNNLGIGSAWKYQDYKPAVCKTEDKEPFVFSEGCDRAHRQASTRKTRVVQGPGLCIGRSAGPRRGSFAVHRFTFVNTFLTQGC